MTNITVIIKRILAERDAAAIMEKRREEFSTLVEVHGVDAVAAATGLKVNTVSQYVRDKYARISMDAIDQAKYVFNHPQYLKKNNNKFIAGVS